jgi:RNA polymerase sigma factor (sigma-70 family)
MKKYNVQNYVRYKQDLDKSIKRIGKKQWQEYTRDELITVFMPLVENIARKFATSQQASGVMSINDLIQEGNAGLTAAVDRIVWDTILSSEDQEKTLKSFLSKRIKGAIRRGVDINRGDMRIPEHKLNEIRRDSGENKKMVQLFFNSVFSSIDEQPRDESNMAYQIPDNSKPNNTALLNAYVLSLLRLHLDTREIDVLRMSYGLDCEKFSASEIAKKLGINGTSSYVRVSQLKKQAIDKLIENVDHSQVIDFL